MRSPLRLSDPPVAPGFTGRRLTACNLCEAICGLELTLTDGRVTSVRGNPDDPFSRGYICPKGVAFADVYDDPDRLRRPIVRRGDDWVEVDWDEALDLVARPPGRDGQRARPRRRRRLPRQPERPRPRARPRTASPS